MERAPHNGQLKLLLLYSLLTHCGRKNKSYCNTYLDIIPK